MRGMRTARSTHDLRARNDSRSAVGAPARAEEVRHQLSPVNLRAHVAKARTRFDAASNGCNDAMNARLADARRRLGLTAASLDALSPLAVLQRGYAIAQDREGRLLRRQCHVAVGDAVRLRLAKGRLDCRVEGKSDE